MGYNPGDLEYESGGGIGQYEATIIHAGAGKSDFGPELVFVCKPTNLKRRVQTLHMSLGKQGDFVFGGASEVITTGSGEKSFDVTVYEEILSGPKINILTNSGLFLNALKHLGIDTSGANFSVYVGMKLDLEEIKYNYAIRIFNETHPDIELPILGKETAKTTIPVKIISKPLKKITLRDAVMNVIDGTTEPEMDTWYKGSMHYDGTTVTPLYHLLAELEKGEVLVVNGKYMVKKETEK